MELFTVNRYTEPDQEKIQQDETEILQKLLKKVEKRKRKHLETKQQLVKVVETDVVSETIKVPTKDDDEDDIVSEDLKSAVADEKQKDDTLHFEVLGNDNDKLKRQRVNAVLPSWLAHPQIISSNIVKPAEDTASEGLSQLKYISPQIRGALKEMSITRLFPVQEAVIPWILEAHNKPAPYRPRDVCVSAPTGSGKTLAFAIPVIELLSQRTVRKIRALVILPVTELAVQVYKVFKKLCDKTDLKVCLLSNQTPLPVEKERLVENYKGQWYSKVDIVVTTPGRLVDHLHATQGFCVKNLKFLVIDEADRIMDAVFQNWLYHLHEHVRSASDQLLSGQAAPLCYNELELSYGNEPHKLLFSATLSQDPEKLQNLRLFQPILFTSVLTNLNKIIEQTQRAATETAEALRGEFVGQYTTPAELTEKFCLTESRLKPLTLFSLIKDNQWNKFLCFTNSVESSGRLSFVLKKLCSKRELVIEELSASMNAKERSNVLSSFLRGKINGVVCSDALARGIDVPNVDIVISYDPPRHIKTYIHRVGRTARAGRPGTAITMLTQPEQQTFEKLLKEVGKAVSEEITSSTVTEETHAKDYQIALEELRKKISTDKRMRLLQKERAKEQTLMHKDKSSMTLMEKLQLEATTEVYKKTDTSKRRLLGSKKNPTKNKEKKLKAKSKKQA